MRIFDYRYDKKVKGNQLATNFSINRPQLRITHYALRIKITIRTFYLLPATGSVSHTLP